jgi:hypothetical protein
LCLISFVILSLFIISYFYGDKICSYVINEINKNITTQIIVEKTKFELFQYFPDASIRLSNITIKPNKEFNFQPNEIANSKNVLFVKEISLKLNFFKLLKNIYIIKGIIVKDGYLNIIYDKNNKENYKFWSNKREGNINLNIRKISLINLQINYYKDSIYFNSKFENFTLNGIFNTNEFKANLQCKIDTINYSGFKIEYSIKRPIYFDATIKNDSLGFGIQKWSILKIDKNKFYLHGKVTKHFPYNFTLELRAENLNLQLLNNFPEIKIPTKFKIIEGNCTFSSKINGNFNSINNCNVEINASINKSKMIYNNNLFKLKQCYLKFSKVYSHQFIEIELTKGSFKASEFSFHTKYNISKNQFDLINSNLVVNMKDLSSIFPNKNLRIYSGIAKLNIELNQKGSSIYNSETHNLNFNFLKVACNVENLNLIDSINDLKISKLNTKMVLKNNTLYFSILKGNINNIDLQLNGNIENFNSIVNDSIKYIYLNGNIKTNKLNLKTLLNPKKDITNNKVIIHSYLNFESDTMIYDKLLLFNTKCNISYDNTLINIAKLRTSLLNGKIEDGFIKIGKTHKTTEVHTSLDCNNISISELFRTFDNFGQTEVTFENFDGNLNSKINANLYFDAENKFDKYKSEINTSLSISNGKLTNFKPLYSLSKFISVDELNNLKFDKLNNTITINNNLIVIPTMVIKTSAFDITVSGIHSLDNVYEYHFKVLLSDFLFRKSAKKRKENLEFGKIEEDTIGRTSLYIKLIGHDEDYHYSYDTKFAIKSFSQKMKNEKIELKKIFKEEFGLYKKDTTLKINKEKKNSKLQIEYSDDSINPQQIEYKKEKKKPQKQKIEWKDQ